MSIDQRLSELGITLPQPAAPVASYVPAVEQGGLLHISGQISFAEDGSLIKGRLGEDMDLDGGIAAARRCGVMLLAQMKAALGSLDRVERVVKLGVFVNSAPSFTDQPKVANGASELMQQVFGEAGRHARSAVGVAGAAARRRGRGRRHRRGEGLVHPRRPTHLRAWPTANRDRRQDRLGVVRPQRASLGPPRRRQSFHQPRLPFGAGGFEKRRSGDRVDPRADRDRGRRRRGCLRPRQPMSRPTARANMCSTMAGPMHGSARAANIIPSSRSRCRSRPVPGAAAAWRTRPPQLIAAIEAVTVRTTCRRRTSPSSTRHGAAEFERRGWLIRHGSSFTGQSRLWRLRRLPCRAYQPQAQGDPQGARGGARGAEIRASYRRGDRPGHWDAFWEFTRTPARANGAGLI